MKMRICGEACNGLEAVEIAKTRKPGLILMDLSMPQMNGVEAASVIKKESPESYIIVFTLYQDNLGKHVARAAGVDVIVSKAEGAGGLVNALAPLLEDPTRFH